MDTKIKFEASRSSIGDANGIHRISAVIGIAGLGISLASPTTSYADPDADWQARSTGPGVVMATRFDTLSEVTDDTFPDSTADHVSWEQGNKASGNGSLRMDILKTDGSASGSWVRYLADNQREFGTNETFYVQYRQYFPQYFATHTFSGGGWKQSIISNHRGSNQLFEVVLQNTKMRGLVQGYNRNSQGTYAGWDEGIATPCSHVDFVYQNQIDRGFGVDTCLNARRSLGGLYSYGSNTGVPDPETGAFIYYPDEWLTFMVKVTPGTFGGGSSLRDTNIQIWAAREDDSDFTLLIDRMVNLGRGAEPDGDLFYFDSLWLLPYNTSRTPDPNRQDTYTLYDEVIVSTQFIPAPNSDAVGMGPRPKPITDLTAN